MGKELSHGDYKDPKKQIDDAFKEMKKGFEKKVRDEFGPEFANEFIRRIEEIIRYIPQIPSPWDMKDQIKKIANDVLQTHEQKLIAQIDEIMRSRITEIIKQVWVDFIRNEIKLKLEDPATIIAMARKMKELP